MKNTIMQDVPKCDFCGQPAAVNLQSAIIHWNIDNRGNYSREPAKITYTDDTNVHACSEHVDDRV